LRITVFAEHLPPRMGSDRRIYELMKRITERSEVNFVLFPSFRELQGTLRPEKRESAVGTYKCEGIIAHRLEIPNVIRKLWKINKIRLHVQHGYVNSQNSSKTSQVQTRNHCSQLSKRPHGFAWIFSCKNLEKTMCSGF